MEVLPAPAGPRRTGFRFVRRTSVSTSQSISWVRPMTGPSWPSAASRVRSRPILSSSGVVEAGADGADAAAGAD